jgi:hypothetical protein
MLYLSASSIKDLFACDRRYYYRVNKPSLAVLSDDIIFGEIIHKAIATYDSYEDALEFTKKEQLNKSLFNRTFSLKKSPKNAEKFLRGYYTGIFPELDDRGSALIEHEFEIDFRDNVKIIGKFDRIDRERIFDWKTGTTPPNIFTINDIQFHLYWWAYKKIFKSDPKSVCYGYLYGGLLYNIGMNASYLNNVDLLLDKAVKQVYNTSRARETGFQCGRCLYRKVCWEEFNESDS